MSDGRIVIDVEIDDKKAVSDIDAVEKKVEKVGQAGEKSADGIKQITIEIAQLKKATEAIDNLTTQLQSTSAQAGRLESSVNGSTEAVDRLVTELKEVPPAGEPLGDLPDDFDEVAKGSEKASMSIKSMVTSLGLVKLASSAISVLRGALDDAITRFDTMNQFPKVMEAVGFGADESTKAIERLTAGVQGLPTRLNDVVSTAQRLGMMTKDLRLATDLTISLNNAFLASGAGADGASRGLEQYLQMLSTGKADMQSWKILQETMGIALNDIAETFGMTVSEMYSALQDGSLTFDELNKRIIELNDGVGGFAERALIGSEGIATSFANISTSIVNGVEKAIRATDELVEAVTGKNIAQHLDSLKGVFNSAFTAIAGAISGSQPAIEVFASVVGGLIATIKALDVSIVAIVAGLAAFKILNTIKAWFIGVNVAVNTLKTTKLAYLSASQILTAHQVTATATQKLLALAYGVLTNSTIRATVATKAYSAIVSFLSGPLGWVTLGVAALSAALYTFHRMINRTTPELEALTSDLDSAQEATKSLSDRIESSADAFDKSMASIDSQADSMSKLIDETVALAKQEKISASEKKILQSNVDSLNESISGLGLAYDEETQSLTHSAEAMQAKIDLMREEEKLASARKRLNEIEVERNDLMIQQRTNAELLARSQAELDGTHWLLRNSSLVDSINELKDEQDSFIEKEDELAVAAAIAGQMQQEAAEGAAEATRNMVEQGITSLNQLSDAQRSLVENTQSAYQEYADIATSVFDKVADESKASIEEMLETSRHNNEAMLQMAEEAAGLRDRFNELGLDQSIIDQFINMGTEGPALISELTTATDEQLKELVTNTDSTSSEFQEAFMKMFDIDEAEFADGFMGLVTAMETSLTEQLAESDLKKSVTDALTSDATAYDTAGSEVAKAVAAGVGNAAPEMEVAGGSIAQSTAKGITDNTNTMVEAFTTVMGDLVTETETGASNAESAMSTGMSAIVSAVETAYKSIVDSTKSTATNVVSSLQSAIGGATQAGRDTGAGFRVGLEGQRSSIMATARSIASDAVRAMRSELQTASPSKVTTKVGEDTGQGVVVGLENKFRAVRETARALASYAVPSVEGTSYMQGVTNNNVTNNYTQPREQINVAEQFAGLTFPVVWNDNLVGMLTPRINQQLGMNARMESRGW